MTAADESPEQEFTYADIAAHTSKKDAYVVIHDLVYDVSRFVDEHPYVVMVFIFASEDELPRCVCVCVLIVSWV